MSELPAILQAARGMLGILFVVAIPLVVVGTALRWVATDRAFMEDGFRANGVAATTRIDERELSRIAGVFAAYFQGAPGRLDVQAEIGGQQRALLNEREILHMEDVQALVQRFLWLQVVGIVVVVVRLMFALAIERSGAAMGAQAMLGAGLMVGIVAVVLLLAAIDFPGLWTRFHYLAFRNELWMLDPRRDYLIMLFPQPFWLAATVRLALCAAGATLLVGVAGFAAWRMSQPGPGFQWGR